MNTIGLPYYRESLASAWPDMICDVGAPPPKYEAQFIAGLKAADWGFYGPNSRDRKRNQAHNTRELAKGANTGLKAPKFLSEKAREGAKSSAPAQDDKTDELLSPLTDMQLGSKRSDVPVMYRNVEIKYSKFGVDDFDFG